MIPAVITVGCPAVCWAVAALGVACVLLVERRHRLRHEAEHDLLVLRLLATEDLSEDRADCFVPIEWKCER